MNMSILRRISLAAVFIGIIVGLFAAGFTLLWAALQDLVWFSDALIWRIPISIGAGFVVGLILTFSFYPGSLSSLIQIFHRDGRVPLSENIPVIPSNLVGLVGGQSAGPEGALSAFGGSIGTWIADRLKIPNAGKLLTLAGMGAGFGTILGAPVGGALLWLELPHERGMEYYEALTPTLLASIVGYMVMTSLVGFELFPHWNFTHPISLTLPSLLGAVFVAAVCVIGAMTYTRIYRFIARVFDALPMPLIVRTTVAGALIGVAGYFVPLSYFYGGKHSMSLLLGDALPLTLLAVTLIVKMFTCSVTIHGYWQGGLIIPQMFMGALVGQMCGQLVPWLPTDVAMLCGIGAFNAAVTGSPLASALIAISLTHTTALAPVFAASILASLASPTIRFIQTAGPRTEEPGFHLDEGFRTRGATRSG